MVLLITRPYFSNSVTNSIYEECQEEIALVKGKICKRFR